MDRRLLIRSALVTALAVTGFVVQGALRADATVHPLQSAECAAPPGTNASTDGDPPGISGGSNADNFAQPALATIDAGALTPVVFPTDWTGPASNGDNGDQHCQFPEGGSHPDDADDTGVDAPFPGGP